ncbi:MAG: DegT/DnrJ/EryC1/StrS family aminotransferase [Methanobrevibacter boviskoreani]|jgi:perosamine synthetase|uniref:DegT/DnrJ/EryC1/StrS family aminotransferase n=1 Tax=Methanobrevibacter boviskoreani TaxID=1348249 RepID=UPI0023A901A7|nr:DegT/DnrJ/EryC1/StrS family aminotransferase [Methanobrevibacter boviskoreani]MCI6774410.1 DegT/DnrJ/EryC1/StrS family aminotransferase [Methanobrevibacter boviskoreani]MCI6930469.1 DegT/DnrJ/EryC1/StrS family aminotransferase [Methanobrevibacter boviskoreani]MDD6256805.1 DegT/DnrJ/EryC1/StrS family aminotransferase [Methanobrevibacter boviskoreani]MDY5615054.1 DegT/DnrJ/EryC1/StrS family aminotransferase [Methanobrevibacter boviskoreani]
MAKINIAKPIIEQEEIDNVVEVLKSGMIAQGPKVSEFEEKFAQWIGTKYGISTSSGTTALHTALLACGIGEGDEVITVGFTFAATSNSVLYTGARPVFVDIDEDTFTMDPSKIEDAITDKTKAILVVQLYGQSADMDPILDIAHKHNLLVIEDAAQAHGAEYKGRKVGTLGDVACFSFYPTKNMTTGEGGMITTDNEEIAKMARIYRAHGSSVKYHHDYLGYNFRSTDIAAAIGLAQLKKIDSFNDKRNENASYLTDGLKDVNGVVPPVVKEGNKHVFHQYTIKVDGDRDKWLDFLNEKGIGCGVYYPIPLYNQKLYKDLGYNQSCPVTDKIVDEVISLPVHPSLTKDELDTIISVVKEGSEKFC